MENENTNLFEKISILNEAREQIDTGMLTVTQKETNEEITLDALKRYQSLEEGGFPCQVEDCKKCSETS